MEIHCPRRAISGVRGTLGGDLWKAGMQFATPDEEDDASKWYGGSIKKRVTKKRRKRKHKHKRSRKHKGGGAGTDLLCKAFQARRFVNKFLMPFQAIARQMACKSPQYRAQCEDLESKRQQALSMLEPITGRKLAECALEELKLPIPSEGEESTALPNISALSKTAGIPKATRKKKGGTRKIRKKKRRRKSQRKRS